MSTPSIRDYESLFYGGGEDAKYAALKAFADNGVTALSLLSGGGGGGAGTPTDVVFRFAVGVGGSPTTADYELVADDIGKLVVVQTSEALPIQVLIPDDLGSVADRIEISRPDGTFAVVASGGALVVTPSDRIAESRADACLVLATKVSDLDPEVPESGEAWLLSYDLADGGV